MAFYIYILQNESNGRYYCGHIDNVDRHLKQYNDPLYKGSRTTKVFKVPWKVVAKFECKDRSEAVQLEYQIKTRGIG